MNELPLFARARRYAERTAILDQGRRYTYRELLEAADRVAGALLEYGDDLAKSDDLARSDDLAGARVAFLAPPSFDWVAVQWGILRAGGVAVPLALAHPAAELEYALADSGASAAVAVPELADRLRPVAEKLDRRFLTSASALAAAPIASAPPVAEERAAMVLYTSGTTGKPKGVVLTHANLRAMAESLVAAWGWRSDDHILEFLPLHHLHGIVNVVTCALWSGARCETLPRFDAEVIWRRLGSGEPTLLMAVPTIYRRLIAAWEAAPPARRDELSRAARRMRLMISGSAALPVETLERWREISSHTLLERYGMTEIGMALGNPLDGERRPGCVGKPMPGLEIRLVDEDGRPVRDGEPGEIEVRGPTVFKEYLDRPEATREAFRDGFFRTGDQAVCEDGVFRILGRQSVDILKTGGEKVSALEIEAVLRQHEAVAEVAVVGVPDPEWGQRVSAAVILEAGAAGLELEELKDWARPRLAAYKIPRRLLVVEDLPRNALGKVVKPRVVDLFEQHRG